MKRNSAFARYGEAVSCEGINRAPLAIVGGCQIRECDVEGCTGLAMDGTRCNKCREELDALQKNREERERIDLARELSRQERREKFENLAKVALESWLLVWDWLRYSPVVTWVLGVFVVLGWAYACFQWGRPLIEWLMGVQ